MAEKTQLSKQQREAARLPLEKSKYQIIEAVAGSGKTTVAAGRIDYLVESEGIDPSRIVAITFTRSGGESLKRKIAHSIGYAGTLHGLAMKKLSVSPSDLLTDTEESEMMKEILSETGLKKKISLKQADGILMAPEKRFGDAAVFSRAYSNTLTHLRRWTHNEILRRFLSSLNVNSGGHGLKIDALIVDEAQDTSAMDAAIYSALAPEFLTVAIGDKNQSIYQFRGATGKWMKKISEVAGDNGRTPLSMSYRFGAKIAKNAAAISGAKVTGNPEIDSWMGCCRTFENERDEETALIEWTAQHAENGCAILTRYNADVDRIRKALESAGQTVQPQISLNFSEKSEREIITTIARVIDNPASLSTFGNFARIPNEQKARLVSRWENYGRLRSHLENEIISGTKINQLFRLFMVDSELLKNPIFNKSKTAQELLSDLDSNETGEKANDETGVFVETVHASKGREWNAVAVSGWDSRLNSAGSENIPYVAITRGKTHVLTTRCKTIVSQWTGVIGETKPFKALFG